MLARLVLGSVRHRIAALVTLVVVLIAGGVAARALPSDAMPDVSTIQVSILTTAPGLSPVEVERTVTVPIENAMNGIQGGTELRSTSPSETTSRSLLGISMPMALLPGIGLRMRTSAVATA